MGQLAYISDALNCLAARIFGCGIGEPRIVDVRASKVATAVKAWNDEGQGRVIIVIKSSLPEGDLWLGQDLIFFFAEGIYASSFSFETCDGTE